MPKRHSKKLLIGGPLEDPDMEQCARDNVCKLILFMRDRPASPRIPAFLGINKLRPEGIQRCDACWGPILTWLMNIYDGCYKTTHSTISNGNPKKKNIQHWKQLQTKTWWKAALWKSSACLKVILNKNNSNPPIPSSPRAAKHSASMEFQLKSSNSNW